MKAREVLLGSNKFPSIRQEEVKDSGINYSHDMSWATSKVVQPGVAERHIFRLQSSLGSYWKHCDADVEIDFEKEQIRFSNKDFPCSYYGSLHAAGRLIQHIDPKKSKRYRWIFLIDNPIGGDNEISIAGMLTKKKDYTHSYQLLKTAVYNIDDYRIEGYMELTGLS